MEVNKKFHMSGYVLDNLPPSTITFDMSIEELFILAATMYAKDLK